MALQSGSVGWLVLNFVSSVVVVFDLSSRDIISVYVLFLLKRQFTSISPILSLG